MRKFALILALLIMGISAAEAQKVRVMSYNVHNCIGVDGIKSYKRCAEIISESQPDIVAVQEVDSMSRRNNAYVLGEMAKYSGYHAYYHRTIPYKGGSYGIGVLSKMPALSVDFHPLPCRKEPRGAIVIEFDKYYLIATHLSLVGEDRLTSVDIIKNIVSKLDKPVFIAGDMNAHPTSETMKAFKEFSVVLNDEEKFTISSDNPHACIDYVLGANGKFKVVKDKVFYGSLASDHLPLYVDVKIGKSKKSKR